MSKVYCYRCMMLKVSSVGELCRMCQEGWESPTNKAIQRSTETLDDWSLEQLIATQETGDVPGQRRWEDNETCIGSLIDAI